MSLQCFSIDYLPDLSLHKYQSLADTGVNGILTRHNNFLRLWNGICASSNTSLHLLACFDPKLTEGKRLKLYLMIQGEEQNISAVKPLLHNTSLSDFYQFNECALPNISFNAGATLIKKEQLASIYHELSNSTLDIHYVPAWETNDSSRLYDLYRLLATVCTAYDNKQPAAYRIDLYPADIVQSTRKAVNHIVKTLNGDDDIQLTKKFSSSSDQYAQSISKEYESWMSKIESSPVFRCNIYAFAANDFLAKMLLNAAGSEAVVQGDYTLEANKPDANGKFTLTSRLRETVSTYCTYPQEATMKNWATTYTLDEISPFFRLPVLFEGESIDTPKESDPAIFDEGLLLGKNNNDHPVMFPIEDLPRHAFFTGMPGSGKTNTMLHVISELRKKDIPFLVMEPAKKEYRALLANPANHDIHLFSPHLMSLFPLKMNPFAFVKGTRLSDHINALLEVFQGTFFLEGPTYKFLSSAIENSYIDLGWEIDEICTENSKPFPTLSMIYNKLESEINTSSYDGELKGNMKSFLQVRLGGLMERDSGELFNTSISTLEPEEWLTSSAIVELETLPEQAKNFFVLLVCHYILQSLRVHPNDNKTVRHVLFIEEAHNIIAPSTLQASSDSVDPKISATQYIVKMLAEVRALKESIVIADQLPTALASEVTKNTGLKVVHRLTAQDDREQIGTAISATGVQMEEMASFTKGKALIYHEKTMKPFTVQINKWEEPVVDIDFTNDYILYNFVKDSDATKDAIANYLLDYEEKYLEPLLSNLYEIIDNMKKVTNLVEMLGNEHNRCFLDQDFNKAYERLIKLIALWNIDIMNDEDDISYFCKDKLQMFMNVKKVLERG